VIAIIKKILLFHLIDIFFVKLNLSSLSTDRLVEIRTILERMRPVEHKLKYQIEKLLKIASTGKLGANDPLQFKANPANLMSKERDDEDSSDDDTTKKDSSKSGAYVPPKLAAMHYDEDDTSTQRTSKIQDKVRRHMVSSSTLQGLREEFLDTPAEIVESNSNEKFKAAQERKSIQE